MNDNNQNKFFKYISFLVYPWFSLFYSLKSLNTRSTHHVIFAFFVFFGLAFTPDIYSELDSAYYLDYFLQNRGITNATFWHDLIEYLSFGKDAKKDFFVHTITYIVSVFTQNYHFYFGLFAAIFGLFCLKSFRYLTINKEFVNEKLCFFLAFIFIFSNPIFNINGVRFWTAAWISIFFIFKIILDNRKRYLYFMLLIPLVHSAFWIIVILFFGYYFLKNKKLLMIAFFVSFFLSSFMLTFVKDITDYLPSVLQRYVIGYTSEGYMNYRSEQVVNLHWYIKVLNFFKVLYPNILIFFLLRITPQSKKFNNLFRFILILIIFCNLTISIPSVGNRFILLIYPLVTVFWLYHKRYLIQYNFIIYLYPLIFIKELFLLYQNTKEVLDPYFYVSPTFYFLYHIVLNS